MKKYLLTALTAVVLFFSFSLCTAASYSSDEEIPEEESDLLMDFADEQFRNISQRWEGTIPEEAQQLLEKAGLEEGTIGNILSLSPNLFWQYLKESALEKLKEPVRITGKFLAVLLLCGLIFSVKISTKPGEMGAVFSTVSVACMTSILIDPVLVCIQKTASVLEHCAIFMMSFVPALCSILTVNGQPGTATGYHFILFGACQILSQCAVRLLIPGISMLFALYIITALFPETGLPGMSSGLKNMICWGLGGMTTVFTGILSLQTLVTSSADGLTVKASKFLMGNFIPVVGSALSDAFSAVHGCISLIKGAVGVFGIVTAVCAFAPVLIQITIWYGISWFTSQIGIMLQVKKLSAVLKGAHDIFAILLALVLSFASLLIVSTALVLILGSGRP